MKTAVIVDDLAVDRQLAARALRQHGWDAQTARNSVEAMTVLHPLLAPTATTPCVIITDLDMPADPSLRTAPRPVVAGANFALTLRTSMEQGLFRRVPIIALTALSARETHLTALAFGCDAVLHKPAAPPLMAEIDTLVAQITAGEGDPVGSDALLQLLRLHLREAHQPDATAPAVLTAQDITRALLTYHRQGLPGLGTTTLATTLVPQASGALERGQRTYDLLAQHLKAVVHLGVQDAFALLHGELIEVRSPAEQCAALAISLSEYYRRRQAAVQVLLELISTTPVSGGGTA